MIPISHVFIQSVYTRRCFAPEVTQVLPDVVEMLPNDDTGTELPTEVTASLCYTLINLSQRNTQHVRAAVDLGALHKIVSISTKDNGSVGER